ncbi:MAG: peptidylprolyl isomerase [Candidatus Kerfeldbacteria bacterium]|nr:peptidylprolyl isomerase [Candidatus Kerfeldbacteria bacterium]
MATQIQGSEADIAATLEELYGWTIDDFKQQVVRELVLRQKLQDYLLANEFDSYGAPARQQLVDVQQQLQADPNQFASLAEQYSQDGSASNGGDLGWFSRGQMVAPFEEAAFALTEPNQLSDIVQTEFGFHLIQLIERKAATDTEPEQVHARHILIKFDLDSYLEQQREQAQVRILVEPTAVPF